MRKRWIIVSLACGALGSLAACGNYAIPDNTPLPSQTAAITPFEAAEAEARLPAGYERNLQLRLVL